MRSTGKIVAVSIKSLVCFEIKPFGSSLIIINSVTLAYHPIPDRHAFSPQTMHFYFDITLQLLIMKKDLKLDFFLLYNYMYTNFLFVYPASSVGKRVTPLY